MSNIESRAYYAIIRMCNTRHTELIDLQKEVVCPMKLTRICKSADSQVAGQCPAMYVADVPTVMVGQGKRLDAETAAELLDMADDETAVAIPTETVLRAAAMFLADRGRPVVAAEVEAFLAAENAGGQL